MNYLYLSVEIHCMTLLVITQLLFAAKSAKTLRETSQNPQTSITAGSN